MISLLSYFIGNVAGLIIAARVLPEFVLANDWASIATLAFLLMLGNAIIRPIVKLFLHIFIILSLGLFAIIINAAILAAIDFFSVSLTITSIPTLLYATLIISIANLIVGGAIRIFARASREDD